MWQKFFIKSASSTRVKMRICSFSALKFLTFIKKTRCFGKLWRNVKFGFCEKMYYLCITNVERPQKGRFLYCYIPENQDVPPLRCVNLPPMYEKLPQRKGFWKTMDEKNEQISAEKKPHFALRVLNILKSSVNVKRLKSDA